MYIKKIISAFLLMAVATASIAQQKALSVKNLAVKFKIKNAGINVNGYFKSGKATILFDEKNVANSKFTGIVNGNSIFTDNNLRDSHLKDKKEFFDVAKYPELKMESVKIIPSANGYNVQWNITIKGVTKSITAPVTYVKKDGVYTFGSIFKINRRDWNVGEKSFIMSDNLEVNLSVTAN